MTHKNNPVKRKEVNIGAWRSLVAHLVWDQGVASSNLAAPTKKETKIKNNETNNMNARIFKIGKSPMQSGKGDETWMLEFEPAKPTTIEPLMGYTSTQDTQRQVKLKFKTQNEAVKYATKNKIKYKIIKEKINKRKQISYSDNFRYNRKIAWTH